MNINVNNRLNEEQKELVSSLTDDELVEKVKEEYEKDSFKSGELEAMLNEDEYMFNDALTETLYLLIWFATSTSDKKRALFLFHIVDRFVDELREHVINEGK